MLVLKSVVPDGRPSLREQHKAIAIHACACLQSQLVASPSENIILAKQTEQAPARTSTENHMVTKFMCPQPVVRIRMCVQMTHTTAMALHAPEET